MSRASLRVAVLHNAPALPPSHPDAVSEADVVEVALAVVDALRRQGLDARPLAAAPPIGRLVESLGLPRADVVFNLIEGYGGTSAGEARVTALLELMGLAYTGCPSESQALCHSKGRTKAILRGLGLPTAAFALVGEGEPVHDLDGEGPWIVKPDGEDASLGIDQASVVTDRAALLGRVRDLREAYGGRVVVEAYLPGPEFNVGVLALPEVAPLPVAEVVFDPPPGAWPILTYAAKWSAGSLEDLASPVRCPAQIEPALAHRLGLLAVAAFRATGCRDYARVDLRLDARGEPMVLEVNPNPDVGPEAGWARALRASGREYDATLAALARQAFGRGSPPG